MEEPIPSGPRPGMPQRRLVMLLAAALTVLLVPALFFVSWRASRKPDTQQEAFPSPYKNTRPGVKYVGDAACARCHDKIAATYRLHPMGRSLLPIAAALQDERGQEHDGPFFETQGLQYSVKHSAGRVVHIEARRLASGRIIAQNEVEVCLMLGSGRQASSFLIERDGFLTQSPITWYAQKRRWDLSPGYEKSNQHFDRPVQPACLFCHANRVEPVAGSVNRYSPPIFQGRAIGCERCHGPGELHVAQPTVVDGRDITIVNPADLEPALREAVCEQCHLNGQRRVLHAGRQAENFRPGLPFSRFWTVLELPASQTPNRFVGQVEQMHQSRCFRASEGRLGCISCHDPHQLPDPANRVGYYRNRCLECHTEKGCSLADNVRLAQSPANDCAGCHMPRSGNSDVLHTATTDHHILRRPDLADQSLIHTESSANDDPPLVIFHRDLLNENELSEAQRDIGVALCRDGPKGAALALPRLEAALKVQPDDATALESTGFALGQLGRGEEALAAFRAALEREPERESSLAGMAYLAARGGRRDEAIDAWRRAIAISPWRSDYHAELAPLYFQARDWHAAANTCRATLRLNPANIEIRKLLVRCYLRLRNEAAARREFETLLGFDPPDRDELRRWFTPLAQFR